MSLDELLNDNETSALWRNQKKRLTRVVAGVSIITLSLLVIAVTLLKHRPHPVPIKTAQESQEANLLAQLLRLREYSHSLQGEVDAIRQRNQPSEYRFRIHDTSAANAGARQIIDFDPGAGFITVDTSKKDVYIPTGAVFQARLITPIKTSIERTFVMAETTHEFRMDMQRRIPKGSRLIGRSTLNPILKGVVVEFDKLVLPAGIETQISGLALSRNALPEIEGLYVSNDLETYGTALAFGFLSGFSAASETTVPTVWGAQPTVNLTNQLLSGLSTASFQVADDIINKIRQNAVEYVVVPAGEPVFVALTRKYEIYQRGVK